MAQVVVPPEQQAISALQAAIKAYPSDYDTDPTLYQATISEESQNVTAWSTAAVDICHAGINSPDTVELCAQFVAQNARPLEVEPPQEPVTTVPGEPSINDLAAFSAASNYATGTVSTATSTLALFDRCGL